MPALNADVDDSGFKTGLNTSFYLVMNIVNAVELRLLLRGQSVTGNALLAVDESVGH